jgi:capsule polysaccharide modification protein KpsS
MKLNMKRLPLFNNIDKISKFLKANKKIGLKVEIISKKDKYLSINEILWNIRFRRLSLYKKHIIFKLLRFFTGYSLSHLKRLAYKWRNGTLKYNPSIKRNKFSRKYFSTDIKLLIDTDIVHHCLSGEATKRILRREF